MATPRPLATQPRTRRGKVAIALLAVAAAVGAALAAGVVVVRGPLVFRLPEAPAGEAPSELRLRETVRALCVTFAPRSHRDVENLDRAAAWIAERFRDAGLEVRDQPYRAGGATYRNVAGLRPGLEPDAGVVVLGAHYDAFHDAPGADDDASGIAVLLEVARTLPKAPLRRSVDLVAFSTEEPPYFGTDDMGSARFARRLAAEGRRVHAMIALDMVGYFRDEPGSQGYPLAALALLYPDRGDFLAVVGDLESGPWIEAVKRGMLAARALPVRSFRAPRALTVIGLADHASFRRRGLPGVLVTDTGFLRNPHYHRPTDTPDTLDFARMAAAVRCVRGALLETAGER